MWSMCTSVFEMYISMIDENVHYWEIPTGNKAKPLHTRIYTGYPPWMPVKACVHEITNTITLNHHYFIRKSSSMRNMSC